MTDSGRTLTIVCGHCGTLNSAPCMGIYEELTEDRHVIFIYILVKCLSYGRGNMLMAIKLNSASRINKTTLLEDQLKIRHQWPEPHVPNVPEDVPDNVRVVYTEAERAYAAHIYSAAAERYRKSLQLAVKEKGATKGPLISQINKLHDDGVFPSGMKDMAHTIRLIGNAAAHDEPLPEEEAKKEAEAIREFADLFMTYLFTLPARIIKRQQDT